MRFADVAYIWELDVQRLSRLDQGRLFLARARVVLLTDPQTWQWRGRKLGLCQQIGCGRSAITQNRRLRSLIEQAETDFGAAPDGGGAAVNEGSRTSALVATIDALDRLARFSNSGRP